MFDPNEYELLDFACGEKVERFGKAIVRRQTPSVPRKGSPVFDVFSHASMRFRRDSVDGIGRWEGDFDEAWQISHRGVTFLLRPTPAGQVGLFPEQASNWDWILDKCNDLTGLNAINLFGYTGGTTLALAKAGAKVTHVDAAKTAVSWARENADASKLGDHPIRWIAEDAMKFAERELKRGNRYDIVAADPPSFGRGPSGETWKMERDFERFLLLLAELTDHNPEMIVLSCHTPGFESSRLRKMIENIWNIPRNLLESGTLTLETKCGKELPSGEFARWKRRV